jgi:hypothetical protein
LSLEKTILKLNESFSFFQQKRSQFSFRFILHFNFLSVQAQQLPLWLPLETVL